MMRARLPQASVYHLKSPRLTHTLSNTFNNCFFLQISSFLSNTFHNCLSNSKYSSHQYISNINLLSSDTEELYFTLFVVVGPELVTFSFAPFLTDQFIFFLQIVFSYSFSSLAKSFLLHLQSEMSVVVSLVFFFVYMPEVMWLNLNFMVHVRNAYQ